MRRHFRLVISIGLAALSFVQSCTKDDGGLDTDGLLSLTANSTQLVLPARGSAEVGFFVESPAYMFNYHVGVTGCEISLQKTDGNPSDAFYLTSVVKKGEGSYVATITDAGKAAAYTEGVQLVITSGKKTVKSQMLTVKSDEVDTRQPYEKTGLPVVYINTERPVTSKENYVAGKMRIDGVGSYEDLEEAVCQVRGRGNTTWSWAKKPYLVKFEKQQHVFGMHKHKRYILLANFMDRTMMRNIVACKVSSLTSLDWTPGCQSVELVLNGKHLGNYLLIEQIRVDKHRVPVTEMTPADNEGEAVTGGYLLESDFHWDNAVQWLSPWGHNYQSWSLGGNSNCIPFGIKFPDSDDLTPPQLNYIKGYIEQTASTLYGANFKDPENGYSKYIDVKSFIDYWIVFELMINHELGNPGSVFLHKDRGGKLIAGPIWDFDWGTLSYNASPHARSGLVNRNAYWYGRLFEDPDFADMVRERWNELLPELRKVPSYIDELEKQLSASAELNFAMWNPAEDASQNGGRIINGDENMTFHNAVARIKEIYEDRLETITKNLP